MKSIVVLLASLLLALSAHGQQTKLESRLTCVEGRPVYKGNAPFVQLHLRTSSLVYRLDFSTAQDRHLEGALAQRQNDMVKLCGQVTSDQTPNSPILKVHHLETSYNR